jgi:hypothetical protein
VTPIDVLKNLPLLTAAVWFALAGFQVYRDRVHTWTESFFLVGCFFAGLYAISDWVFFNAPLGPNGYTGAQFAAIVSFTSVILTALFLFLFTLVYVGKMKPVYYAYVAVTIPVLVLVWLPGNVKVDLPSGSPLYFPIVNPIVLGIVLLVVSVFAAGGAYNLYRIHKIVREYSEPLARRSRGLLFVFVATLVLGLSTNGYLGATKNEQIPPLFSTLLAFVAGATLFTLYPGSGQRISVAIRRFQARRYSIKAAFVTYRDGTLIASKVQAGESIIDRDLFGATLDVIQNFMRTSFPLLRGKSLRTIKHGDYSLIIERAEFAYLTVVLGGEESDQLRRQMRDLLLEFEAGNRNLLAHWKGIPEQAMGTDKLLDAFFIEEELMVHA